MLVRIKKIQNLYQIFFVRNFSNVKNKKMEERAVIRVPTMRTMVLLERIMLSKYLTSTPACMYSTNFWSDVMGTHPKLEKSYYLYYLNR